MEILNYNHIVILLQDEDGFKVTRNIIDYHDNLLRRVKCHFPLCY